ncbi:MAG: ComF family protein [Rhodospirillales bacterium]|nr:ComF family protein [Rhodospirillales bacterium]
MAILTPLSGFLDTILPPRCLLTGEVVETIGMLSPSVWTKLNFISRPFCDACGLPFDIDAGEGEDRENLCGICLSDPPPFSQARAALRYDNESREVILAFKHGDRTEAVRAFAPWMRRAGADILEQADLLLPVPLHRWRLLRRRYNQAALMASALSRLSGVPWRADTLVRTKPTPAQGHMNHTERTQNVRNAFAIAPRHSATIQDKNIVLVDDVYTTGATVGECARVLARGGARTVTVLTLARVVRGS